MPRKAKIALAATLLLFVLASGCRKKVQVTPPPQAQAPTATQPAQPPAATQPAPTPTISPTTPSQQPQTTPEMNTGSKPKPTTHTTKKTTTAATTESKGTTTKKVVPATGTESPATGDISVGMNQGEAAHERQATESLLAATQANLNGLNRTLTSEESAMVEEVKNYMVQARQAITDSDLIRANNLAMKAHLLSDALVKH